MNLFNLIRKGLFILAGALALFFLVICFRLPQIPSDLNRIAQSHPTHIYSDRGQVIKVLANRQVVPLEMVSRNFLNAIMAIEDAEFYHHHGFSKKSFLRAMWNNLKSGRIRQGGSTITQQLAKNLFFSFDRSWWRKIKEALVAFQVEQQFSKDAILEAYVNQIDFGSGIYGIELAAQNYFSCHSDELSLAQAALIAGIPRWPYRYNPYQNPTVSKERQAFVLKRMTDAGFITEEQRLAALQEELAFHRMNEIQTHADYFVSQVLDAAGEKYGRNAVNYGGLEIYTSLSTRSQFAASKAVEEGLDNLDELLGLPSYKQATWEEKINYPQAALVAIDPKSGAVKAMVGGRDFRRAPFNRAVSNIRMPGSAFKLFTYFAALDKGVIDPTTVIVDESTEFKIGNQIWRPRNFEGNFRGPMTIKYALQESENVIAAKIIEKVTPAVVVHYAHEMGIKSDLEEHLSISLGATAVSPLEMASAYATLCNQGVRREPFLIRQIKDKQGRVIEEQDLISKRVVDAQSCYIMIDMLRAVVENGTAKGVRALGFMRPCAGKTGTSSDFTDAWFIGFTPELVAAVWVGFDDNRPMQTKTGVGITGGRAAVPIWTLFMKQELQNVPYSDFPIPPGIEFIQINPTTGQTIQSEESGMSVAVRNGFKHDDN